MTGQGYAWIVTEQVGGEDGEGGEDGGWGGEVKSGEG